jgi:hypothetical protein
VDISITPEENRNGAHVGVKLNNDEVLAVSAWQRHLRDWKRRLDGQREQRDEAGLGPGWKDIPPMADGTAVGVKYAIVKGAVSNSTNTVDFDNRFYL